MSPVGRWQSRNVRYRWQPMNLFAVHEHRVLDEGLNVKGELQSGCAQLQHEYRLLQLLQQTELLLSYLQSRYLDGQKHHQIFWYLELQKYLSRF